MSPASMLMLVQVKTDYAQGAYFLPVVVLMLVAGLVLWLVAAVLGFARAMAFGPATRWFAIAAVCMILYHLQFLLLALGAILENSTLTNITGAFFNLFEVVAAICAIMGFVRLTNPR